MLFRRSLFSSLLALALALALVFALAPASVFFADDLDTSSRDWDRDDQTAQLLADRDDRSLTDHLVVAALCRDADSKRFRLLLHCDLEVERL
jgi:hypothetical protein